MKKLILIIIIIVIIGIGGYFYYKTNFMPTTIGGEKDANGCLIGAGYSWCEEKQKCMRKWEESCYSSAEDGLLHAFADKYNRSIADILVKISEKTGEYVFGIVEFAPGGEANRGSFLALDASGEWKIVYDGQNKVACDSIAQYNFPKEMTERVCE